MSLQIIDGARETSHRPVRLTPGRRRPAWSVTDPADALLEPWPARETPGGALTAGPADRVTDADTETDTGTTLHRRPCPVGTGECDENDCPTVDPDPAARAGGHPRRGYGVDPDLDLADAGMSTVEYAVGTVVAAAFAAVLYKIVTGDSVVAGLTALVRSALDTAF